MLFTAHCDMISPAALKPGGIAGKERPERQSERPTRGQPQQLRGGRAFGSERAAAGAGPITTGCGLPAVTCYADARLVGLCSPLRVAGRCTFLAHVDLLETSKCCCCCC